MKERTRVGMGPHRFHPLSSWYPCIPPCHHQCRRKRQGTEVEFRVMHFWNWGKEFRQLSKSWKRQWNRFSSRASKRTLAYQHLDFNPVKLILNFYFKNYKIINSCCTPPSLQYYNSSYRKKIQILVPASGGAAATNTKKHRDGFEIR